MSNASGSEYRPGSRFAAPSETATKPPAGIFTPPSSTSSVAVRATVSSERVDDPAALRAALLTRRWDVVLCDWTMPQLTGITALAMTKALAPDLPFIIVSGTIGEERAVVSVRAGAQDYVLKDNLGSTTAVNGITNSSTLLAIAISGLHGPPSFPLLTRSVELKSLKAIHPWAVVVRNS